MPSGTLTNGYTYYQVQESWWTVTIGNNIFLFFSFYPPNPLTFTFDFFIDGVYYPAGTEFEWSLTTAPNDKGWWLSIGDKFNGAANVISNVVPRNPRSFDEISSFAAGSAGMMGGFPGVMAPWNNRLIYAKGGYTVGTDRPPIHIFDGEFDREIATIPTTTAGTIPKGAVAVFTADGQIFISTLDSGSDSASWSGRVFSLNVETAQLSQIGDTFPAGHVPYALAWHQGKLWCGTNRQSSAAAGKLYSIRPGVDLTWTLERDMATDSLSSITSLLSFQGLLYVGTANAAASFAKVLVRNADSTYSSSLTASGGTARANNCFLALAEFSSNMYASFWNPDTTAVSKIYKFDGTTWTNPFSASTTATRIPYVGFPTDLDTLLAIGGGLTYSAALLSTTDGTTWTDHTSFLTQSSPTSTGLPAFGVVIR